MNNLFEWCLQLPQYVASFGEWLTEPLDIIGLSPLGIFTIGGATIVITIIGVHIVRLFVG